MEKKKVGLNAVEGRGGQKKKKVQLCWEVSRKSKGEGR